MVKQVELEKTLEEKVDLDIRKDDNRVANENNGDNYDDDLKRRIEGVKKTFRPRPLKN